MKRNLPVATPVALPVERVTLTVVLTVVLGSYLALIPPVFSAQSAAQTDWLPTNQMTSQARLEVPFLCDGMYQEPAWLNKTRPNDEGVHLSADDAVYEEGNYSRLTGDVEILQRTRLIQSGEVDIDLQSNIAELHHFVRIRQPGLFMTGSEGTTNLETEVGSLHNATFVLHSSRLRGSARELRQDTQQNIILNHGSFTRCEPGSNVWQLRGRYIRLEPSSGFGTAKHVTLVLKDITVGYIPYLRFPIDDQRHSGFLVPSLSHDSNGGVDISAPYYFNIAPDMDLTYSPRSIWKRGILNEAQFRYMSPRTLNELNIAILYRDDIFDDRNQIDQTDSGSGFVAPFEKQDRWFVNLGHDGGAGERWVTQVSYSAVSDNEYLHDIGANVGAIVLEQYVTDVDESLGNRRNPALERLAEFNYRGKLFSYLLRVQGFQTLTGSENYQRLPQIQIDFRRSARWLRFSAQAEYTYFDKDNENTAGLAKIIGGRLSLDASLSVPLRRIWGFFEPELLLKYRRYRLDDVPGGVARSPDLLVPVFALDSGLIFDRLFKFKDRNLQQTLEPRLFFLYAREEDQSGLPKFDSTSLTPAYSQLFRTNRFTGKDRIGDARQLSVGVTSRFLDYDSGSEIMSFSLGQIYYFDDRNVVLESFPGIDNEANFSALFAESRLTLRQDWQLIGNLEWEPRNNRTNRSSITLRYNPDIRHIFNFRYRYTNDEASRAKQFRAEESDLSFIWPIRNRWSAIGRWNFSWDEDQTIESFFGVEYNDCCWKTRLVFRRFLKSPRTITTQVDDPTSASGFTQIQTIDRRADTGIFFEFQLKGLATLGGKIDSLLDDGIFGYRERENELGI